MPVTRNLRPTETAHIFLDDRGRPWIDDTAYRVAMVVGDYYGPDRLSPERIAEEHYHELTLAQIHAALSYYHDHKAEIDAQIEQEVRDAEALMAEVEKSPQHQQLMQKLRAARAAGLRS